MWTINQPEKNHFMVCNLGCCLLHHPIYDIPMYPGALWNFGYLVIDLQLDVKGCRDVYDSFDKYVEVERLEGDNKYHAEQYGLQVKSETIFFSFNLLLLFSS